MDRQERLMVQSSLEHLRQLLMTGQVKEAIKYLNESLTPIEDEEHDEHTQDGLEANEVGGEDSGQPSADEEDGGQSS